MPRKASVDTKMGEPVSSDSKPATRKTERSHEENQERAYIAASRRADRSIEARVQSARMASEIHKKRTGKGFKITQDIVLKEEMYEEEDDDLPRSYRLLSASMQTSSPEMNSRLDAYLSNKMAMSQMLARTNDEWRENEVNRLFAASFPNALPATQQLSHVLPGQSLTYQQSSPKSFSPTVSPTTAVPPTPYSASFSGPLTPPPNPAAAAAAAAAAPPPPPPPLHRHSAPSLSWSSRTKPPKRRSLTSDSGVKSRRNSSKSITALSKRISTDNSSTTGTTPILDNAVSPQTIDEDPFNATSSFTINLPPEARMMLDGVGADATLDQTLANLDDSDFPSWLDPISLFDNMTFPTNDPMSGVEDGYMTGLYEHGTTESMASKCAMPNSQTPFEGSLDWRSFIDDSMWTNDQ